MSAGKKSPPDDGDEELVDPEAEGEEDEGELHGGAVELPHQYRHQLVHKSLHLNWLLFRIVTFSVKKCIYCRLVGTCATRSVTKASP